MIARPQSAFRFLGIDARHYWLLMDLFAKLSSRREISIGKTSFDVRMTIQLYSCLMAVASVIMAVARLSIENPRNNPAVPYLTIFMVLTVIALTGIVLAETASLLVNPIEALALAHYPVNGATYSAAKLTHLIRTLLYGVFALNTFPAFVILLTNEVRWFYPASHLLATLVSGFLVGAICCSVFGLLIRFVPASRLKEAGHAAQFLPIAVLVAVKVFRTIGVPLSVPSWLPVFLPAQLFLFGHNISRQPVSPFAMAFAVVSLLMIAFGIRSLRVDYLVRAHAIAHGGGSAGRVKVGRPVVGEWVSRICGGQIGRAGFDYGRRMMLRDWEFKRRAIFILPMIASVGSLALRGGANPFSASFSWIHVLPHAFGLALFWVCSLLAYGEQGKAGWVFQLVPESSFRVFVRGVHLSLWFPLLLIPHLVCLLLLGWWWGLWDAILFVGFSLASSSLYLAAELRLIEGIPFFNRPDESRGSNLVTTLMIGTLLAAIAIGIQHLLIFRSHLGALIATTIVALAALMAIRSSLDCFQAAVRNNIARLSGAAVVYREVN